MWAWFNMEKGKRVETLNDEIALPEAMIQHVQSFPSGKEAARTTILSKTWYNAWLTRPTLDLRESDFHYRGRESSFERFVMKTLLRYLDLSLKIHSFSLRTFSFWRRDTILKLWIASAMKMGLRMLNLSCPIHSHCLKRCLDQKPSSNYL